MRGEEAGKEGHGQARPVLSAVLEGDGTVSQQGRGCAGQQRAGLWGAVSACGGLSLLVAGGVDSRSKSLGIGRLVRALEPSTEEVMGPLFYMGRPC